MKLSLTCYNFFMSTITIEIPKKVLQRGASQCLLVVDPKEYSRLLRVDMEVEDAKVASRIARQEWRHGKRRLIKDLKELIK